MRAIPLIAAACAALSLVGTGSAAIIGVNEDAPKTQPSLYGPIADSGLRQNVLSMIWAQGDSTPSTGQTAATRAAIAAAQLKDVKVVIAIYPGSGPTARALAADAGAGFIAFATSVVTTFPNVTDFIVGNEPNRTIFQSPVDPALFTKVLAGAYSAIKGARPDANVIGIGLSPRGSGDPRNQGGGSLSMFPVQYLLAMGKAYRDQGLSGKIMDALSFHPYPFPEDKAPDRTSDWPTIGMADLARLKQAIHDAFNGTGQPADLPIHLDEVAYQVPTVSGAYLGGETVRVVGEATQATFYAQIVNQVACDPRIASVSFFHFIDEADRGRFQSGFQDVSGLSRPALAAVKQALADTAGGTRCNGTPAVWAPATGVIGASALTDTNGKQKLSNGSGVWGATLMATEDADFLAGVFPEGTTAEQAAAALAGAGTLRPIQPLTGKVTAQIAKLAKFELSRGVPAGRYLYAVVLSVATPGGKRSQALVTTSFQVGRPATRTTRAPAGVCKTGFADADGNSANGCEVNLRSDLRNCDTVGAVVARVANTRQVGCTRGTPRLACVTKYRDGDKEYGNGCEQVPPPRQTTLRDGTCRRGFTDVDGEAANGCEVAVGFDLRNCAAVGDEVDLVANASAVACKKGKPVVLCIPGFKNRDRVFANGCEVLSTRKNLR